MIRREADGQWYVELQDGQGRRYRWGGYSRADAAAVEKRNRAQLAAQPSGRRRPRTPSPQLRLLDAS